MHHKTDWTQLEPRICEQCEEPFYHRVDTEKAYQFKRRRFCGNECTMEYLAEYNSGKKAHNNCQIERVCVWCGKVEMKAPCFAKRPYCSRKCMREHAASGIRSGSNHWNWQGGITEDEGRDSLYPGYKEWRRLVFKRDNFKCALCGNHESGCLRAHHIKPVATHKELVTDVANGLTVCLECHKEIHYGKAHDNIQRETA